MALTKLPKNAIADDAVTSDKIADGTVQNVDISGSISNDKLTNSSFTFNGTEISLGASQSIVTYLDWQAVQVADGSTQVTAEAGKGYFLDTNAGVIEVFLPSSPTRGDVVGLVDYAGTFGTNQLIINTGGVNIDSTVGSEFKVTTNNAIVECVYVDAAKGWLIYLNQAAGTTPSSILTAYGYDIQNTYITATGGTISTSGDFKIHTFTGDGCFVVSAGAGPRAIVDYLVVAGGGAGGNLGGAGAGGYRESHSTPVSGCYTASPLATPTGLPVSTQTYPITVGGGGTGSGFPYGANGSNSIFSTITSAGGGGGPAGPFDSGRNGQPGGSAGGGHGTCSGPGTGGTGNTPSVSPPQGNDGGDAGSVPPGTKSVSGGGGGAGAAGNDAPASPSYDVSGNGGNGVSSSITGSPVTRAGGGGGGVYTIFGGGSPTKGLGGSGGGGNGGGDTPPSTPNATSGTVNTGSGGGGAGLGNCGTGITSGSGGSGIVVIRYKFQ
jgi:hypothetical protein